LTTDRHRHESVDAYDYALPDELIAQVPIEPRDAARMLVVDRGSGAFEDRVFRDLPRYLRGGDLLVVNDTKVMPARIMAQRGSGGRVEFLLLERQQHGTWTALARPARRLSSGESLRVLDDSDAPTHARMVVVGRQGDEVLVRFEDEQAIQRFGRVPLPPYIRRSIENAERYQTVYARHEGSAAAPTAGMHFTPALLDACRAAGAAIASITLHVGRDTFQPIRSDSPSEHVMHSEWFNIPDPTLIREVKRAGGRIFAVGTTSVRALESAAEAILAGHAHVNGSTRLFITPGHEFRIVDGMITNFHLPRTTLLLLVSAFASQETIRRAYGHAIEQRYRFYSFGDAMLIV
jgi:S-adenosylmethionine:tRNA ribosyltransferase-isomerase